MTTRGCREGIVRQTFYNGFLYIVTRLIEHPREVSANGRFFCASFLAHQNVPHVFRHPAHCWLRRPPAIFPRYLQDLPDGLLSLSALYLVSHIRELHLRELYLTPAHHRADPV
jgi:hypothetical protein